MQFHEISNPLSILFSFVFVHNFKFQFQCIALCFGFERTSFCPLLVPPFLTGSELLEINISSMNYQIIIQSYFTCIDISLIRKNVQHHTHSHYLNLCRWLYLWLTDCYMKIAALHRLYFSCSLPNHVSSVWLLVTRLMFKKTETVVKHDHWTIGQKIVMSAATQSLGRRMMIMWGVCVSVRWLPLSGMCVSVERDVWRVNIINKGRGTTTTGTIR